MSEYPDFTQDQFTVRNAHSSIRQYNSQQDKRDFKSLHTVPQTLTDFRTLYENCVTRGHGVRPAVRLLQKVNELTVNPRGTADRNLFANPNTQTIFRVPDYNIDYLFAFPKDAGLAVLLSPIGIQRPLDWVYHMHLGKPTTKLRTKYGLVGFDPVEAVLSIGQQGLDHIWLAMCLNDDLVHEGGAYPANEKFGEQTSMTAAHYRIVVAYLIVCLASVGVNGTQVNLTELWKIPLDPKATVNWAPVTRNSMEK